jgi:hypothetical protein
VVKKLFYSQKILIKNTADKVRNEKIVKEIDDPRMPALYGF